MTPPRRPSRLLVRTAATTGAGVAVVGVVMAIVAVAVLWLPVAGSSAHPTISAMHAGVITFLAALHGGVRVDGASAAFLPLGLTVVVGGLAWRAGRSLGSAAAEAGETDPARLAKLGLTQAAAFVVAALVAVPFGQLGTSGVPAFGVAVAAALLFALTGGLAFVRASALREWLGGRVPAVLRRGARTALAGLLAYGAGAALLVAASAVWHHRDIEALSGQVGGGWAGLPVLLLGLLSAPNAVIAGAAYVAGPGFAVGAGTHVGPLSSAHGVVPAFPILGALPEGNGATPAVWVLLVLTVLGAGAVAGRAAARAASWRARFAELGVAVGVAVGTMFVLAWQAGGGIGGGRLHTVGASPWQAGLAVGVELGAVASAWLGVVALAAAVRQRPHRPAVVGLVERADEGRQGLAFVGRASELTAELGRRLSAVAADPKAADAVTERLEPLEPDQPEDGKLAG